MCNIEFSESKLDHDTFFPYVEVNFSTKLTLDKEFWFLLETVHKTGMEELLAADFKHALEKVMPQFRNKYNLSGRKDVEGTDSGDKKLAQEENKPIG